MEKTCYYGSSKFSSHHITSKRLVGITVNGIRTDVDIETFENGNVIDKANKKIVIAMLKAMMAGKTFFTGARFSSKFEMENGMEVVRWKFGYYGAKEGVDIILHRVLNKGGESKLILSSKISCDSGYNKNPYDNDREIRLKIK